MELKEKNGVYYVSAIELHRELGIKRQYSNWIKYAIESAMLCESDFITILLESTGGRPTTDYLLTKMAAISIAVMSRGQNAKIVRDAVLKLYEKHDTGMAFTSEQIMALVDISKSLVLVSIQKDVERKHYHLYGNKYEWWNYRAQLTGISTDKLIKAMAMVNKKHKNVRASLLKLDPHELIRIGAVDLFIALGKPIDYAKNVGMICKQLSQKINVLTDFWDDTKQDALGIKSIEVNRLKSIYNENTIHRIMID